MPKPDNSVITTVYRKPSDILAAKFSVIKILTHRTKTVCSSPQLLKEEEDYLKEALQKCKYPFWALSQANTNPTGLTKAPTTSGTTQPSTITSLTQWCHASKD